MIFLIAQGLAGSDDDRITSMDTQRIEVLHVTNRNTVVAGISDNLFIYIYFLYFLFEFLPAFRRLLDQNLGRQ